MVRPYAVKGRKHKKMRMELRDEAVAEEVAGRGEEEVVAAKDQKKGYLHPEKASLEIGKVGKNFHLLNSDDHGSFLRKQNLNPADYRPDIVHNARLTILDSPLSKNGRLQALYVRTEKGVLMRLN
ncbi:hypothetical protein J5N97_007454 [Dioscorea zingiberensis]|uniref:Uncharacterized protein n=1 Tax=Dioscorea zingiberensis TaxID=325984 RepID=A0A9D5DBT4_9LILI|nr:hypothetical protein J5N97_007454 [Dioscorea zingiberensis]